jgi:hypothetical protein
LTDDEVIELSKEVGKQEAEKQPMVLTEDEMSELERYLTQRHNLKVEETETTEDSGIKRLVYSKNGQNQ